MRVLIIKTSSMGDIIHTFPAVTDAAKAISGIRFDWVAEEAFVELPLMHPQVDGVIPVALRRWRKNPWRAIKSGEVKNFQQQLRAKSYDLVIDAQASKKSAIITRFTRGLRCGLDKNSVREALANLAYQKTFFVERKQHAILRLRQLFAQALNYPLPQTPLDYGIDLRKLAPSPLPLPNKYLVFIHNSSWATKCWPEAYWIALLKTATQAGFQVLLPWGTDQEKQRAQRIAAHSNLAQVLPKLGLAQLATVLANAAAAVCVDTGLAHLAAALNVPAVTLYGPTNPALVGTMGVEQRHLCADFSCAPCRSKKCHYQKSTEQQPACFTTVTPEKVWLELQSCLNFGKAKKS